MYNYQTFLRETKFKQKCQQIRKQHNSFSFDKQKKIPCLIQSHKKRVQAFILSMVERPIHIQQYRNNLYKPRQVKKQKIMGKTAFYINHHTSKERIQEQSKKNKQLDQVPFSNPSFHNFRPHNVSYVKPFKYTPSNSSMRVKESLQKSTLNYLDINLNKKVQMTLKFNPKNMYLSNYQRNNKSLTKMVNKTLLPQLHQKTYFHSINTIYSQSPCSFLKVCIANQKQNAVSQAYEQQTEVQTRKQILKISNDHANRRENSKQALIKCGLLKIRKDEKNGLNYSPSVISIYR